MPTDERTVADAWDRTRPPGSACWRDKTPEFRERILAMVEALHTCIVRVREIKTAYVAWTNTDCTEGRGNETPLAVCLSRATAERLGHKQGVQGSNCNVTEENIFWIGTRWFGPVRVHYSTKEDDRIDVARQKREAALEKARIAGLTDEEILALRGQP